MNTKSDKDLNLKRRFLWLAVLCVVIAPMAVLYIVITGVSWPSFETWSDTIIGYFQDENKVKTVTLITGIGLVSFMLQEALRNIWVSVSNILKYIGRTFFRILDPDLENEHGPTEILGNSWTEWRRLLLAVLLLGVVFVCGYVTLKPPERPVELGIMVMDPTEPPPNYLFEKGGRISLVYPPQGDLNDKDGICPRGENLEWLKLYRRAISGCKNGDPVKLTVQGYASTAPVSVSGIVDTTDTLNCRIANQRAESLIYFLTLADIADYSVDSCTAALESGRIWAGQAKSDSTWKIPGINVSLSYKRWLNYSQMHSAKLVNDGSREEPKRFLQFLNRTVLITIEDGGCLTNAEGKLTKSN